MELRWLYYISISLGSKNVFPRARRAVKVNWKKWPWTGNLEIRSLVTNNPWMMGKMKIYSQYFRFLFHFTNFIVFYFHLILIFEILFLISMLFLYHYKFHSDLTVIYWPSIDKQVHPVEDMTLTCGQVEFRADVTPTRSRCT